MSAILDMVEENDIKSFINQYAKKNKSFEVILKSHFLSRVELADGGIKYKQILDELIKPVSSRNKKLTASLKKTIFIILEDFIQQMHDCLSTDDFREAYPIAAQSIEKIAYLQNRYEVQDNKLDQYRQSFLEGIHIILQQDLAPAFRNNMEGELLNIINKSYFFPRSHNLISVLNENNVLSKEEKQKLIEDLKLKVNNNLENIDATSTMIQLAIPFVALVKELLLDVNQDKIYIALKNLILQGKIKPAEYVLNTSELNFNYNKEMLQAILYNQIKDFKNLKSALLKLGTGIQNLESLQELAMDLDELFLKKEYSKLKKWIDALPFMIQCKIALRAEQYDDLIEKLKAKNSADWLMVYDVVLCENGYAKTVKKMYISIMDHYMENHIGIKSSEYLQRIRNHFVKNELDDLSISVSEHLRSKYGYRSAIT